MIRLEIKDSASPAIREVAAKLSPAARRSMLGGAAGEVARLLRRHFAGRERQPNKRGWPKQHWWAREVRAATAVTEATENRATVSVASRQFALRMRGGTVKPGPGKRFLALPMRPEVYGRMPSQNPVPGLFFLRARGRAWLANRENGALRLWFRLLPQVRIPADPQALPPPEQIAFVAQQRVAAFLWRRSQPKLPTAPSAE